jgi:deazaflavin-dependent oxidoreductase (nitroreductase family)
MPLPRTLARWNKVGLNRVTKRVAPWMPGFGVVTHAGRRSGRRFQTPVNVFPAEDGYLLALTYGPDSDWVKNVMAAGGCELVTRGADCPPGLATIGSRREPARHPSSRAAGAPADRRCRLLVAQNRTCRWREPCGHRMTAM